MKMTSIIVLISAMTGFLQTTSAAEPRHVVVNGSNLTPAQITWFDRAQCAIIPDGHYWWNPQGGAWGYAGNPKIQGHVGELCRQATRRVQRRSLSQRGLLYRPGDLSLR